MDGLFPLSIQKATSEALAPIFIHATATNFSFLINTKNNKNKLLNVSAKNLYYFKDMSVIDDTALG